jgi:hypothetical protein
MTVKEVAEVKAAAAAVGRAANTQRPKSVAQVTTGCVLIMLVCHSVERGGRSEVAPTALR